MDTEAVRLAVYQSFATTGRAPDLDQLSTRCGLSAAETGDALRRLHGDRHLVPGAPEVLVGGSSAAAIASRPGSNAQASSGAA